MTHPFTPPDRRAPSLSANAPLQRRDRAATPPDSVSGTRRLLLAAPPVPVHAQSAAWRPPESRALWRPAARRSEPPTPTARAAMQTTDRAAPGPAAGLWI